MNDILLLDHVNDATRDDFRLARLCEWAGFSLSTFKRHTIQWGDPACVGLDIPAAKVVLTMGPTAYQSLLPRGDLLSRRGYVDGVDGRYLIPTVSPGFIQRGNARWSAAFINDLQKSVALTRHGLPPQLTSYLLDPSPREALEWADAYRQLLTANPHTYLAFDIETPGKGADEDDLDTDGDAPDRTWKIDRIGFSYRGLEALSVTWAPEYLPAIRRLLWSPGPKVVWNAGFDVPRVRRSFVEINGIIHDGMVAWHILHSDLPKRLAFVATFVTPWQPAWKHLSGARPAFYNATDADVELRAMERIEEELKAASLWEVYQRDVIDLQPILDHMTSRGMPIDATIRMDRAIKLANEQTRVRDDMERGIPQEARRVAIVYKRTPNDVTGLRVRPGRRNIPVCSVCQLEGPRKEHFKRFVKKVNPCADGQARQEERVVDEYFRLAPFTPSGDQLSRYHQLLKRPLPTVYDKRTRKRRVSFAEEQIRGLILKYPDDTLYPNVLLFRELDKLAGGYIGRPVQDT